MVDNPIPNIEGDENIVVNGTNKTAEDTKDKEEANPKKKEITRSKLALTFVWLFWISIFVCFIYSCIYTCCHDFSMNDLRDLLVTVAGISSAPLGFIIGYYFKNGDDKQ
ncbi:MAG: hypothetical protein IKQ33_05210 [Clostridia bacterium]|nr:hypothetical protein [Clostridia bacterium]